MSVAEIVWNNPPENNESFHDYVERVNIKPRLATKYALVFYRAVKTGKTNPRFVYTDDEIDVDSIKCDMSTKADIKKLLELEKEILSKPPTKSEHLSKYCKQLSNYGRTNRSNNVLEKLLIKNFDVSIINNTIVFNTRMRFTDYNVPTSWIIGPG